MIIWTLSINDITTTLSRQLNVSKCSNYTESRQSPINVLEGSGRWWEGILSVDIVCRRQIQSEHQLIFTAATTPVIVNNSPAPGQRYRANQRKYKQQKSIIQEISQLLFATLEIEFANIDQLWLVLGPSSIILIV